jgi:uncharacterized protein YabE (DUF348 family)
MAQPAYRFVAPARPAPVMGPFVPPPTSEIEASDRTHVQRASVPPAARWLVRLAVLAIAIGAPLIAFANEREVTLDVEGVSQKMRTYATDARDLLERKGIEPAKNDMLTPATTLDHGDKVVYRKAKRVELVLDGERKTVTARGLTVGEALKDLGLVPGPKDHLTPAAATDLEPGLEIFVRNAVHTKLRVDGQLRDVVSSADTVEKLLSNAGVQVGSDDYVLPSRDVEPTDGMWIRVVRVRRIVEEENIRVPFRYVTHDDPQMESGTRRLVQQGAEGLKVQRHSVLIEDGRRVSTRLLGETVVRSARDHIVRVGTKEPTYTGGGSSNTGLASWFEADGLVAAHRTLPMGSVVKVTNVENGKSVTVRINQRGPFVDGRIIDLSDDAFERLAPLGQGTVKVKVQS